MSPLNQRQLNRLRDDRREQIKQAALRVFARRGRSGAKMSMIASEAAVSHGLFYRYFQSKEELYSTLIRELLEEASAELEQLDRLPGTPVEQLTMLTANMLDEHNRDAFRMIHQARTSERPSKEVKQALERASPGALIERLLPVFTRGQRSGQLIPGDPRQLLSWYFAVVNSLVVAPADPVHGMPSAELLMRMLTVHNESAPIARKRVR
jgi:AcrR family transcriptional regulator